MLLKYFGFIILIQSCIGVIIYPTTVEHTVKPRVRSSTKAYTPTNSWFENLLLDKGEQTIQTYPYQIKAKSTGLAISFANNFVNANNYLLEVFNDNIVLQTTESLNTGSPLIDQSTVNGDFFNLGVKINFGSRFDVELVRGSASIIARFYSSTPVLKTIHAILNPSSQPVTTKSIKLNYNNGQTWLIQSETPITWQYQGEQVASQSSYSGWIKISIVVSTSAEEALNSYADQNPITNGLVSYRVDRSTSPGVVYVNLEYNNQGLFYLLPHVYENNQNGANVINGAIAKGIKGPYLLASGKSYTYSTPIFPSTSSDRNKAVDTELKRSTLAQALRDDVASLVFNTKDPYFGGKELARAANLIEVADLLNDNVSKNKVKDLLTQELDDFWFGYESGGVESALRYEPTWGGIVSAKSVGSAEADFGQYYYNDHHFHYGYFINTAATLAKYFPDYYNSRQAYFKTLLADWAGTCDYAELPCRPRAKDPFLGHSYAAGIFQFADSRNQESTSESCNAYFAVRELGIATNNRSLEDLGDYLLSTEIVTSKIYWQIKNPSTIYSPPYSNNGVVGILWETKVDYATFFGGNVEFIYGIQMLPFNDITVRYLDRDWLRETKPIWSKALSNAATEQGWRGFLLLADAIIDPNQTGLSEKIQSLTDFDNGNSKTNTLYFYYKLDGESIGPIQTTNPSATTNPPTTQPVGCIGNACTDVGKPTILCGTIDLGCFNLQNILIGCYDKDKFGCYIGGNLCEKPLLPCLTLTSIQQGAPCYDPAQYRCLNGQLIFIG